MAFDLDSFVDNITTKIGKVKTETIKATMLLQKGKTKEEAINLVSKLNLEKVVATKAVNIVSEYNAGITLLLRDKRFFAKVSGEALSAITNLENADLVGYLGNMGKDIKRIVIQGIIIGQSEQDMLETFLTANPDWQDHRINASINTAMNSYSRSVTNLMLQQLPKKEMLIYTGPLDEKTRPLCQKLYSLGEVPRDVVESQYTDTLTYGGGFNCRHRWRPAFLGRIEAPKGES